MKTQNIFRKVGDILSEVNEQYKYLAESPDNLNDLELELLSANADFLAEHIKVLRKLNQTENTVEAESATDVAHSRQYQENLNNPPEFTADTDNLIKQELPESYASFHKPVEQEQEPDEIATKETTDYEPDTALEEVLEGTGDDLSDEKKSDEEAVQEKSFFKSFFIPEPASQEDIEPTPAENNTQTVPNQLVAPVEDVRSVSLNVQEIPEKIPTLNEVMSAQRPQHQSIGQLNKQPVTDLKSLINLNDKLLFIKDLFNGYSLAYSEAIEIINRFDSFDAADNFLKTNYATKNNWAAKQTTAEKFYELLNQRFSR